jgi:hypothetical protein
MFPEFKRNKYFTGKLMSAEDFQDEQDYHIEKRRLHNRLLHGYGVVTGLELSMSDDPPGMVRVGAGYAIDRLGNDVLLREVQTAKLPDRGKKAYVVIEYAEVETDFTPVPTNEAEGETEMAMRILEDTVLQLVLNWAGEDDYAGDGIVLGRLKKRGGVWRVDQRFEVKRLPGAGC